MNYEDLNLVNIDPSRPVSLDKLLPSNFTYKVNTAVFKLMDFIISEREAIDYLLRSPETYRIKIAPTASNQYIFQEAGIEAQKFLIKLRNDGIISELNLPQVFTAKDNVVSWSQRHYLDEKHLLWEVLNDPAFEHQAVISFVIKDLSKLQDIRMELKAQEIEKGFSSLELRLRPIVWFILKKIKEKYDFSEEAKTQSQIIKMTLENADLPIGAEQSDIEKCFELLKGSGLLREYSKEAVWHFDLGNFDQFYPLYAKAYSKEDLEYQKFERLQYSKSLFSVKFKNNREIILVVDGKAYLLSKPDLDSLNDLFFEYVSNNPDKKITKAEIEVATKKFKNKDFHTALNELGFKGEIRKLFFLASKNTVYFRATVTGTELEELSIDVAELRKQLLTLKEK